MKKIIIFIIICIAAFNLFPKQSFSQVSGKVFFLDFTITRNDEIKILRLEFGAGKVSDFVTQSDYTIKIISNDKKTLFTKPVSIVFVAEALPYENETEHEVILNESSKYLRLPFYTTAKYIEIYHSDKKIASIDLSKHLCNKNGICDPGESEYICPEDCKTETGEFPWGYVVISVVCVAILIGIFFYKKSRPKEDWQKVYKKWQ